MTSFFVTVALLLAAASLGLRITSVLLGPRAHPVMRLLLALIIGGALVVGAMQLSDRYNVHDLGLGLLVSLAPVGVFDVAKWWFRRGEWKLAKVQEARSKIRRV